MLKLIPVVETGYPKSSFNWAPGDKHVWVELGSSSSDGDVARVVATLASYNRVATSGSVEEVAVALESAEVLVLPGGLLVRGGGIDILPSCCCGLESWRDWMAVAPGGNSPWLGHDPDPWVECLPDRAIIWADRRRASQPKSVSASYPEIEAARQSARADLVDFTARLSEWLSSRAPASKRIANLFAERFQVFETRESF